MQEEQLDYFYDNIEQYWTKFKDVISHESNMTVVTTITYNSETCHLDIEFNVIHGENHQIPGELLQIKLESLTRCVFSTLSHIFATNKQRDPLTFTYYFNPVNTRDVLDITTDYDQLVTVSPEEETKNCEKFRKMCRYATRIVCMEERIANISFATQFIVMTGTISRLSYFTICREEFGIFDEDLDSYREQATSPLGHLSNHYPIPCAWFPGLERTKLLKKKNLHSTTAKLLDSLEAIARRCPITPDYFDVTIRKNGDEVEFIFENLMPSKSSKSDENNGKRTAKAMASFLRSLSMSIIGEGELTIPMTYCSELGFEIPHPIMDGEQHPIIQITAALDDCDVDELLILGRDTSATIDPATFEIMCRLHSNFERICEMCPPEQEILWYRPYRFAGT